jgi:ABC-2 type transport system ATP-binding protein
MHLPTLDSHAESCRQLQEGGELFAVGAAPASSGTSDSRRRVQDRESVIRIESLTKRFAVRRRLRAVLRHPRRVQFAEALHRISCTVDRGEFFGLLGPNGAGKSTLFKLLSTLILPDEGNASIDGYDVVRDASEIRTIVGLVNSEERSLNWRLSARENLRFYASLFHLRGIELRRRVEDVLATVDLSDTGNRMVGQFSSGMRQRLLIARTLLPRPRVLLLDEPTRSLDPIAARQFRGFLRRELVEGQGCTVLLATHNADEAMHLCDRVAILHRGRLLAHGPVRELSQELGGTRFQVRTSTPTHPAFHRLAREGLVKSVARLPDTEGWGVVEFVACGSLDRSTEILSALVHQGVEVSQFHRSQPALADVIETFVRREPEASRLDA